MDVSREKLIDLGGPDGGRYWIVVSDHAADDPDARNAAVHARLTGSVGCTYNDVRVQRYSPQLAAVVAMDDELASWQEDDAARRFEARVCSPVAMAVSDGAHEFAARLERGGSAEKR